MLHALPVSVLHLVNLMAAQDCRTGNEYFIYHEFSRKFAKKVTPSWEGVTANLCAFVGTNMLLMTFLKSH